MPSFEKISLPSGTKYGHQKTRDSTLSYGKNPGVSISAGLESVSGRDTRTDGQTDRRTDKITIASTRVKISGDTAQTSAENVAATGRTQQTQNSNCVCDLDSRTLDPDPERNRHQNLSRWFLGDSPVSTHDDI